METAPPIDRIVLLDRTTSKSTENKQAIKLYKSVCNLVSDELLAVLSTKMATPASNEKNLVDELESTFQVS